MKARRGLPWWVRLNEGLGVVVAGGLHTDAEAALRESSQVWFELNSRGLGRTIMCCGSFVMVDCATKKVFALPLVNRS